jgi:hypothetical protein
MMGSRISVSIPSQYWSGLVRNVIGGVGRERRGQHRLDGADGPRHGAGTVPKGNRLPCGIGELIGDARGYVGAIAREGAVSVLDGANTYRFRGATRNQYEWPRWFIQTGSGYRPSYDVGRL